MPLMIRITALVVALGLLSACSLDRWIPDRRPDYQNSRVEDRLEIPPDLQGSTIEDNLLGSSSSSGSSSSLTNQGLIGTTRTTTAIPAAQGQRSRLVAVSGGRRILLIEEGYARAWRLVGAALDSKQFDVEHQDSSKGLYVVDYRDPQAQPEEEGLLTKLAFWKDDEVPAVRYQVRLIQQGAQTLVAVYDAAGDLDNSSNAVGILSSLAEVIR